VRIAIVGSTGAGKTTLARELASRLGLRHIELDALHWEPNWVEAPDDVFRERLVAAVSNDGWVADGNYHHVRDILWSRADTLVWLDYSFPTVAWRLLRRTFRRGLAGEELWNGNRERLWTHFVTRDSLFLWLLKTHWLRQRQFTALVRQPEYAHLHVVRLRAPAATRAWLERSVQQQEARSRE
jgi:adenylate kinase family enzyme